MVKHLKQSLILGISLLVSTAVLAVETEDAAQPPSPLVPVDSSNVLTYQGYPLDTLSDRMPENLAEPFYLRFKIKALANGLQAFKGVSNHGLKQFTITKIMRVGTDVGEEDLIQAAEGEKFKALLQQQACILELFPPNVNFNQSVLSWENFIFCLKPTEETSTTDVTATTPADEPNTTVTPAADADPTSPESPATTPQSAPKTLQELLSQNLHQRTD